MPSGNGGTARSTEVVLPVELSLLRPCVSPPGRGALVRVEVCGLAGRADGALHPVPPVWPARRRRWPSRRGGRVLSAAELLSIPRSRISHGTSSSRSSSCSCQVRLYYEGLMTSPVVRRVLD